MLRRPDRLTLRNCAQMSVLGVTFDPLGSAAASAIIGGGARVSCSTDGEAEWEMLDYVVLRRQISKAAV